MGTFNGFLEADPTKPSSTSYEIRGPNDTAVIAGEPVIYGDGEQSRDFIYIDNTIDGTLLASAAEGVAGETFNLACGEATLNELLEHIGELSGCRSRRPTPSAASLAIARSGEKRSTTTSPPKGPRKPLMRSRLAG